MGNTKSKKSKKTHLNSTKNLTHLPAECLSLLLNGYLRDIETLNNTKQKSIPWMISDDIKLLLKKYLTDSMFIKKYKEKVKITLMGPTLTGKSAIVHRFLLNKFKEESSATIEDEYEKDFIVDGQEIKLNIWDTGGLEMFRGMQDQWIREAETIVLCYDITDESTLADMISFYYRVKGTQYGIHSEQLIVICGCKSHSTRRRRAITQEQGQEYADSVGSPFIEVDAEFDKNIKELFELCVKKSPCTHQWKITSHKE